MSDWPPGQTLIFTEYEKLVDVERSVTGDLELVNQETTLCIADFSSRRFGCRGSMVEYVVYNEDALFMRDVQFIQMPDDMPYVIVKNTLISKKYFDAAMRICSSFMTSGRGNWKDIRILVSDKTFQPVAFLINETYAVIVAPIVPTELPELEIAMSKMRTIQALFEKDYLRS